MGELSLFVDMGIDQMSDFMDSLLRLACETASETDDVVVDEVYFVGYSVDGVDSSCGGS